MEALATALPVPAVYTQTAQPFGLFPGNGADGLREGPDMALGIARPILAFAVELIRRLLDDFGALCPGVLTMGVQAVLQPHIDRLVFFPETEAGLAT